MVSIECPACGRRLRLLENVSVKRVTCNGCKHSFDTGEPAESARRTTDGWFYHVIGDNVGPLSMNELRAAAAEGKLTPKSFVRNGVDGEWFRAASLGGLFDQEMPLPKRAIPAVTPSVSESDFHGVGKFQSLVKFASQVVERGCADCNQSFKLSRWRLIFQFRCAACDAKQFLQDDIKLCLAGALLIAATYFSFRMTRDDIRRPGTTDYSDSMTTNSGGYSASPRYSRNVPEPAGHDIDRDAVDRYASQKGISSDRARELLETARSLKDASDRIQSGELRPKQNPTPQEVREYLKRDARRSVEEGAMSPSEFEKWTREKY